MGVRVLVLLAFLAVTAAGCGEDDDVPTTGGPGDEQRPTEVTVVLDGGEFHGESYTITCTGDGAQVDPPTDGVDPDQACDRLRDEAIVRLLVDGPDPDRVCTEIYGGPQRATITGTVSGEAVDAAVTRTNGCEIDTWDRLLASLLPPTQGAQAEG